LLFRSEKMFWIELIGENSLYVKALGIFPPSVAQSFNKNSLLGFQEDFYGCPRMSRFFVMVGSHNNEFRILGAYH